MTFAHKVWLTIGVLALVTIGVATTVAAQEPLIESACFVTDIGRLNDGSFNESAYNGLTRAAEDFGLETTYIETQAQTDYETNINTCLNEGYDAIVTVGFLITDVTIASAAANPDVYFIGIDQFVPEGSVVPNLIGVQFREDQAGFVVGVLAGLMTESDVVAGVYGIEIPPVVKYRFGFENGVHYVNPDAQTLGVYIDDFVAPDRGAAAAEQFIGEGADVIFGAGGQTGSGGITFAAGQGVSVIGVDQDEYFTTFGEGETPGAENLISSAIKRVDNGVYFMLERLVNGQDFDGTGSNIVLSAQNDGIGFAPLHDSDVPAEVTEQVQAALDLLKAGTIATCVDPLSGAPLCSISQMQ